jgi:hypothetical protein
MKKVRTHLSWFLYLFALTIFFSCSKKAVDIPDDILKKDKMVSVLVDIHFAQAAVGVNQFSDSIHYTLNDYTSAIFNIHHITRAQYDSSLAFYTANPELLDEIYTDVINELSKKQSEAQRK